MLKMNSIYILDSAAPEILPDGIDVPTIVYICIGVALLIAIAVFVTIKIVNKKNNKKK